MELRLLKIRRSESVVKFKKNGSIEKLGGALTEPNFQKGAEIEELK
ncbi:MAG: hypothetical protein ACI8WA_000126 [Polaribacter sp.]